MSLGAAHRAILEAFARHHVDFVLIGGVACQLHGWTGATRDVDLTIAIDEANVQRVNAALGELGASQPTIGTLGSSFTTPLGRVELMRQTDAVGEFADWRKRAQLLDIGGGVRVRVGHPDDLLRSKEQANRSKDQAQLPAIRRDFIATGALDPTAARGPIEPKPPPPPRHLVSLLGPRPHHEAAARVWDRTASTIEDFRARHQIADQQEPLGLPAVTGPRASERRHLEAAIERAQRVIERAGREDEPPGIELTLD